MKRSFPWLGPVLAVAGMVSYFSYFSRFPTLRDFPWVNLPVILLGVLVSAVAVRAAWTAKSLERGLSLAGLLLSVAIAGFFVWYVFVETYDLPGTAGVVRVGSRAPSFRLLDQNSLPVTLSDYRGNKVILVFYRGYW